MSEHQDQTKKRGRGPGIKGDLAHAVCKVYETNSAAVTARVFGINDVTVLNVVRRAGLPVRGVGRRAMRVDKRQRWRKAEMMAAE